MHWPKHATSSSGLQVKDRPWEHLLEGAAAAGLGGLVARPSWAAGPSVSRGRTKVVVLGSHGGQQAKALTGANLRCGTSVLIDVDGVVTRI